MTELELYKFVVENNLEYHWHDEDVILFINFYLLDDFTKLLGFSILDEEGIICHLKEGYICIWMFSICENFDIELKNIFKKDENGN